MMVKDFRMLKNLKVGIVMLTLATAVCGQELLKLDQALAIALQNNHQIQVSRNTARISENNAQIGNAGFLPKVDLSAGVNYSDVQLQTPAGQANQKTTLNSAKVQLSYNLFNGLGDYFALRGLQAQAEGGGLAARQSIEYTVAKVIAAYYNVASAAEGLHIRRQALEISGERLQRMQKKAVFGQANKIDVLNAQVDFNADTVAFLDAGLQMAEARRGLNVLLGREPEDDYTVEAAVKFLPAFSLQEVTEQAFRNNSAFLITKNNLLSSNYALRQAQALYAPRLDLSSSYGYAQSTGDLDILLDNPDKSLTAGVALSFNLFNGFRNNIQAQNAKIALKNNQLLLQEARLNLIKDVRNAFSAYRNKRYVLEIEQTNLQSARLNFSRSQELYNLGRLTSTEFRTAQLNLVQARFRLATAKYQAKLAETELLRLSGRLIKTDKD